MSDQRTPILQGWPDGWRLVGLVLSSMILAIVLILRAPALAPVVVLTPTATVVQVATPISPLPVTPVPIALLPAQPQAGAPVVIEGVAPPQLKVRVYEGSTVLGEARADAEGRWRLEAGQTWTEGVHELRIVGIDEHGNELPSSALVARVPVTGLPTPTVEVAPTVVAPAPTAKPSVELPEKTPTPAVAIARLEPGVSRPSLRMHVSIDQPQPGQAIVEGVPLIGGVAPSGAIVRVYEIQRLVGQTTANLDGTWRLATSGLFPLGDHLIWAEALTEDNILLGLSRAVFFTVASRFTASVETPAAGAAVKESQPVFSGTGEPGAHVRVYLGTRPIAETVVDEDGRWEVRPAAPLAPGQHVIRAVVVDEAGRPLAESQPVSITVPQPARVLPLTGGDRPEPVPQASFQP